MTIKKRMVRLHNLKRPKIRADMRKENLYNLVAARDPHLALFRARTFFQAKWTAKSATRAYHGEHVREKQWARMFDRRINSVIPMNPAYLATHDGRDEAAGRGSGRDGTDRNNPITPYMQMTYYPLERRLDLAIFRALFAPSAKAARQLVIHGAVKVNGKKMIYPSYELNPGDLFQVNPDRVMYAMGRRRTKGSVIRNKHALASLGKSRKTETTPIPEEEAAEQLERDQEEDARLEEEVALAEKESAEEIAAEDPAAATKKTLKALTQRTKIILDTGKAAKSLSSKTKQDLRAFLKTLRSTMSRAATATPSAVDDLEAEFAALESRAAAAGKTATDAEEAVDADKAAADPLAQTKAEKYNPALQAALKAARENPVDPSKPWATPWRPRPWMSPFAFIPRYLEVNQNICAAVYLRHPVCGPGFAEVPTPFDPQLGQLAHTWYLRRK